MPKYPEITVDLIGQDGNVFNLIGLCMRAARKAEVPQSDIDGFWQECSEAHSYDEALGVMCRWFNIE